MLAVKIAFSQDSLYDVDIIQEISVQDANLRIVSYILDCGATSAETYNITILKEKEKLKKRRGNIFSIHYQPDYEFIIEYSNKKLIIKGLYPEINLKQNKFCDIDIVYEKQ